jgi:hypothetical protein
VLRCEYTCWIIPKESCPTIVASCIEFSPAAQRVGDEAVPQEMDCDPLLDARALCRSLDEPEEPARGDRVVVAQAPPSPRDEQAIAAGVPWPTTPDVALDASEEVPQDRGKSRSRSPLPWIRRHACRSTRCDDGYVGHGTPVPRGAAAIKTRCSGALAAPLFRAGCS